MYVRRSLELALLLTFTIPSLAYSQPKPKLDVATIMQDPKDWLGSLPRGQFWSEDSKWIYFSWNPEKADADSLYKVSAQGGQPVKLTRDERRRMVPAKGVYSRDYRFKLFTRNGDVFLYDKGKGSLLQITNTAARESGATFAHDESAVIFQQDSNLFRWSRATGITSQLIDFDKGEKPKQGPELKTDSEKFVKGGGGAAV